MPSASLFVDGTLPPSSSQSSIAARWDGEGCTLPSTVPAVPGAPVAIGSSLQDEAGTESVCLFMGTPRLTFHGVEHAGSAADGLYVSERAAGEWFREFEKGRAVRREDSVYCCYAPGSWGCGDKGDVMQPVVGISACSESVDGVASHCVGDKYARAVAVAAECVPVLIPALGEDLDIRCLLERLDGVLVTGSDTGVEPDRYGGEGSRQTPDDVDPDRDATTLPLLRMAVEIGVPVLAICRGHQELNVALGGTLHQFIHEQPGKQDHREDASLPKDERYEPAHTVHLAPDGLLAELFGCEHLEVNSLHWQGIDRVAPPLTVEAWADDGVVEATRVSDAPAFAMSAQWHPEWQADQNPYSLALFRAFGAACRQRATARTAPVGA